MEMRTLRGARATNVAAFMRQLGFPQKKISIRAYAEYRPKISYVDDFGDPITGKALKDARRANRRVEIILINPPTKLEEYGVLFR